MREIVKVMPASVKDEEKEHSGLWRYSNVKVILIVSLIGAIFHGYLDFLKNSDIDTALYVTKINFCYYMVAWISFLIPATLIRALIRKRLPVIFCIISIFLGVVLFSFVSNLIFGQMGKGSLLFALMLCSSYKVTRSYFGLQSIGLPRFFKESLTLNEANSKQEKEVFQKNERCDSIRGADVLIEKPVEKLETMPIKHRCESNAKCEGKDIVSTNIIFFVLYIVAISLLLMYGCVDSTARWKSEVVVAVISISLVSAFFSYFCRNAISDTLFAPFAMTSMIELYLDESLNSCFKRLEGSSNR